jgi:hypothetical protein
MEEIWPLLSTAPMSTSLTWPDSLSEGQPELDRMRKTCPEQTISSFDHNERIEGGDQRLLREEGSKRASAGDRTREMADEVGTWNERRVGS